MSEVIFYERPVPLNREQHKNLRINPASNMSFSAKAHSVPLTGIEFPMASHHFPILFAGPSIDELNPIALLGLRRDENLHVDEEGKWAASVYIPAFIRRYPFVLGESPDDKGNSDNYAIFLDEAYDGWSQDEGQRLFNEDGSDSSNLKQVIDFLGEFQQQVEASRALVKRMRELDLLVMRNIEVRMPDEDSVINGLYAVDEDKLRALDGDTLKSLMENNYLPLIFAHLFSMGNLDRLIERMHERFTPEEQEKFKAKLNKIIAEQGQAPLAS